jgi:subtilisin
MFDRDPFPFRGGLAMASAVNDSAGSQTTGRFIVLFSDDAGEVSRHELKARLGIEALGANEYAAAAAGEPDSYGTASIMFDELGVCIVNAPPDREPAMIAAMTDPSSPIIAVEPERIVYALSELQTLGTPTNGSGMPGFAMPSEHPRPLSETLTPATSEVTHANDEFYRGYRAAFLDIVQQLLDQRARHPSMPLAFEALSQIEELGSTWGLQATRVASSRFLGRNIRLAALDTGLDLHHPDFVGRRITRRSFIQGESEQDGHGHGTHCIGMACGPLRPPSGERRYGVASEAEIFVGKVLNNAGRGSDGGILAGIAWAVDNRCDIVSMSLGSAVELGEGHSQIYEMVARRAAQRSTLIVAAAGNESNRPNRIAPVTRPANSPSIVSVGALDRLLQPARFSCGGLNPNGGEVNIAAPGVDILSTWLLPSRYRAISGTSMAAPCVAGILAQFAEATGLRGFALANHMLHQARRLAPVRDFGWGLVQAP